jgi:hypothetical protein
MDPVAVAAGLVRERFPEALAAFLGATVLTSARTSTSDLDIVVIRPEGRPVFRETVRHAGWTVELFVSTPPVYREFVAREVAARRSPLLHMVGHGVPLREPDGDGGGTGAELRAEALALLAQGPPPPSPQELADLRYRLSDLLDDLDGAAARPVEAARPAGPGGAADARAAAGARGSEVVFIAVALFDATARLALTVAGSWLGSGKWLGRMLRAADPELHAALVHALGEAVAGRVEPLRQVGYGVLDRAGGRLMEGYHKTGP